MRQVEGGRAHCLLARFPTGDGPPTTRVPALQCRRAIIKPRRLDIEARPGVGLCENKHTHKAAAINFCARHCATGGLNRHFSPPPSPCNERLSWLAPAIADLEILVRRARPSRTKTRPIRPDPLRTPTPRTRGSAADSGRPGRLFVSPTQSELGRSIELRAAHTRPNGPLNELPFGPLLGDHEQIGSDRVGCMSGARWRPGDTRPGAKPFCQLASRLVARACGLDAKTSGPTRKACWPFHTSGRALVHLAITARE